MEVAGDNSLTHTKSRDQSVFSILFAKYRVLRVLLSQHGWFNRGSKRWRAPGICACFIFFGYFVFQGCDFYFALFSSLSFLEC